MSYFPPVIWGVSLKKKEKEKKLKKIKESMLLQASLIDNTNLEDSVVYPLPSPVKVLSLLHLQLYSIRLYLVSLFSTVFPCQKFNPCLTFNPIQSVCIWFVSCPLSSPVVFFILPHLQIYSIRLFFCSSST